MKRRGFFKVIGGFLASLLFPGWSRLADAIEQEAQRPETVTELVCVSMVEHPIDPLCALSDGHVIPPAPLPPHHENCRCVAVIDEYGTGPGGELLLSRRFPEPYKDMVVISTETGPNWLKKFGDR